MSIWSALAGSKLGSALAGSVATGLFNQRSANKQMRFQDVSSRTQYQRAVADMKRAGLNPMLATKLGGNAAMSGASASMPDLGATINSAENLRQMAPLREAQTNVQKAIEATERMKPSEIEARINQIAAQIKETEMRTKVLSLDERDKKLLVTTLEAAKEKDPELYKNLKFGYSKTLFDGLIDSIVNVENAVDELPGIVVEFVEDLDKNVKQFLKEK